MKTSALRAGALGCALLTSTALTAPASAQSAAPPRFQHVDANGVDLISGRFVFSLLEGSIGSGDGAVTLERSQRNDYGRTDQWSGVLYQRTSGGTSLMYVQFGGQSDTFTISGSTYTSTKANGATLTGDSGTYTYTAPDGTTVNYTTWSPDMFYPWAGPGCTLADAGTCALPMSVTRPNGMTFTLNWDIVERCHQYDSELNCLSPAGYFRFDGVTSSTGYSFSFTYVTDNPLNQGAPQSNWYVRTGATFTNTVSTPPALPTVTYAVVSGADEITDTGGGTWRITSSSGSITGIRRPGSSSDDITVSYGTGGVVTSVTRDGVTTNYSRSVSGTNATTTVTNALSQQTVVVADLNKERVTSITDPLSRTTSLQYDTSSRLTQITQPLGNYLQYTYDSRGNITQAQLVPWSGSGSPTLTTYASFPATCDDPVTCNQPTSTTDARGNTTEYTYDSTHGGLLTITAPTPGSGPRPETRFSYTLTNGEYRLTTISACQSGSGPSCTTAADEARVVIGYDSQGNVTSVERRDGGTLSAAQTSTYDAYGNLLTVDGPLTGTADTTRYRYNSARRVVGVIGPDPDGGGGSLKHRAIRATYRQDGLPTKVERGTVNSQSDSDWSAFSSLEEVQTEYDSNDRPTVLRLVSGSTTYALAQTSYDGLGRVLCVAQRMNSSEFSSLPSDACTLDTQGSYGPDRITRTTYDSAGQITLVQTGYGVSGLEANQVAGAYTSNGLVQHVTDAEGNRTSYTYDGHDRLIRTNYPDPTTDGVSSGTDYEELTLDANGNVTNRRLRDTNNITFTYDALNRVTFKNLPNGEPDVTYSYDLLNQMTGASYSGHSLTFTYDALGRNLTQVGPLGTATSAYDVAGRRTQLTYPGSGLYINYDYNTAGDLTAIRENGATSGTGLLLTLAYDDRGRRASVTRSNGVVTSYSYDAVSRLSQLALDAGGGTTYDLTLGFTYNPASQIATNSRSNDMYAWTNHYAVNRNYTANGRNQYTAAGSITPTYDSRGNLTSAGSTTYSYTSENLLTGSSSGASLSYDPLMRLFQTSGSGTTTRMAYDGVQLIAEDNGSGTLLRRHVHAPGLDEPLLTYEGTGTGDRYFHHADERGSIIGVSNFYGDGYVVALSAYDEYGIPQNNNVGRFQYTGQPWLSELGMYYYRARIYSPTLGRFLQPDPIGYAGGLNLYAYVHNDPTNFSDPLGLCEFGEVLILLPNPFPQPGEPGPTPPGEDGPSTIVGSPPHECISLDLFYRDGILYGYDPSDFDPIGELVDGLRELVREIACAGLSALPDNGRIRLGADGAVAVGAATTGGSGISIHRDGSINTDRYTGIGGGVGIPGYSLQGGVSIDTGANPPGSTTSINHSVSGGAGFFNFNLGSTLSGGVGPSTPGVTWTTTQTTTNTQQVEGPMCPGQ